MSTENSTFVSNSSYSGPTDVISNTAKFWLYLIFLIPSIACSMFVLYYLFFDRNLRYALNNHAIVVVLIIGLIAEVTIYPWMLYYYEYQGVWHRTPFFCILWAFIDWGLYYTQEVVFAWATIERHILIFHDGWVSTKKKRFFVHYLPLILITLSCLIFYIVVFFFPPCENLFSDLYMICGYICYSQIYVLTMWDSIVYQILPNLLIVLFSVALLARVIFQRYRLQRSIQWRKYRKMAVQSLSISFLYIIFSFPLILLDLISFSGLSYVISSDVRKYAGFLSYYLVLLLPFVCALSLPELQVKIKNIFKFRQHLRTIVPNTWI
jgi:hypothetical protein